MLRNCVQRLYRRVVEFSAHQIKSHKLGESAIIFSPHPDDETLGCGGTILKKREAGADVKVVYMTDGRQSHANLISQNRLAELRAREAREACKTLGVDEDHVIFFGLHDAKLSEALGLARKMVLDILSHIEPTEVFIPYHMESLKDHWATNRSVLAALEDYPEKVVIYEYPIWFWHHWPWVSLPAYGLREKMAAAKQAGSSSFRLLKDFKYVVWIGDVLEQKCKALSCYKSQMIRLVSHPRWLTLSDVSNGEWLRCFFQQHEIFYRYNLSKMVRQS